MSCIVDKTYEKKRFLKKTIATGVAALASPLVLKSENANQSTYDKLSEQVGFNHMPNNEVMTHNTEFYTKQIPEEVQTTVG